MLKNLALTISRLRFLPYRNRRSVMKRLAPSLLKGYVFETEMVQGVRFKGDIINYIDRVVYFCGVHEKYMLYFLRDIMLKLRAARGGEISFVDVGANAGQSQPFYVAASGSYLRL